MKIEEMAKSLSYIKMYGNETEKVYIHIDDVRELKQEMIEKASIIFRNALISLACEKRIDASLIDYNVNLFTEELKE